MPLNRVIRSLRQSIPPGVVIGRRAGTGVGPAELLPLNEALGAQLDSLSNVQGSVLYRGAASWQGLLPGTSGQALTSQGPGQDVIWAAGGGGSSWYFAPPTTTTLATAVTEGSVTGLVETDDPDIGLAMQGSFSNPDNAYLRLTALGTLPKTVDVRLQVSSSGSNRAFGGLCLRNSTTTQRLMIGHRQAIPVFLGTRQATGTTFDAEPFADYPRILFAEALWLRAVVAVGGATDFYHSADGKQWTLYVVLSAAQVCGAGVDQVGVGIALNDFGAANVALSCQRFTIT